MKNIVSFFMITMLVVAQADDTSSPSSASHQTTSGVICLVKCAFKCRRFRRIKPLYIGCVALCRLSKCRHKVSSKAVYDCATNCAISKSNYFNTDARGVNVIVNSCMEVCHNK
ncbi:Thionin related (TAP1) [Medicago truncatula]|uniref:Thionin related (TAP1) n=1 Tax=Medicago truncatula TaxID=3880 RepID=A0A072V8D2_MEDTR|nr:Thionin related (TAP1) [Medicago truncatula]